MKTARIEHYRQPDGRVSPAVVITIPEGDDIFAGVEIRLWPVTPAHADLLEREINNCSNVSVVVVE
jgi:hypothetical protein